MLLFWGLIVVVVAELLVRRFIGKSSGARGRAGARTALDTLRERYAKGEIDKEEFEQEWRELGS